MHGYFDIKRIVPALDIATQVYPEGYVAAAVNLATVVIFRWWRVASTLGGNKVSNEWVNEIHFIS